MGLIANGYRLGYSPFRHVGGALISILGAARAPRNMGQLTGRMRGIAWLTQNNTALPQGALHPTAWMLPQKPGGMASRGLTTITLTAAGSVSRALAVAGTAGIEVTAAGQVGAIGSVAGSSSMSLTAAGSVFGRAAVAGSANFTLNAAGQIGALVFLGGSANITLTAASTMGCTARVAGAAFLSGAAEGETLSETGIASAVWSAAQSAINVPGTAGAALMAAGGAGDPWITPLPGTYPAGSAGAILAALINGLTSQQSAQLADVWRRLGLGATQTTTKVGNVTTITDGTLTLTINENPDGSVTVARA